MIESRLRQVVASSSRRSSSSSWVCTSRMRAVSSARSTYRPIQNIDSAIRLSMRRPLRWLLLLLLLLVLAGQGRAPDPASAGVGVGIGRRARASWRGRRPAGPASTQVSLEPPPREEFTISSPSRERDPGQAAGQHPDPVAVVDRERAQVDVPRTELAVDEGRHRRQLDDRLGDPGARVVHHLGPQLVELGPVAPRTDHDALAAGAVDRLEHQLVEPVQDLLAGVGVAEPPGVDVAEHRLLVEVVADQVGQVGVDELVVGDAVADRVGERDVAGAGGVDQARGSRAASRPGSAPGRGTRRRRGGRSRAPARGRCVVRIITRPAAALQVAALDQLDAHRAGEQRVLEVGAVVDARREHDDGRVGDTGRGGGAQRGEQPLRVAGDRTDPVLGERSRAAPRRSRAGWSSRRRPRTAPARCPRARGTRRRRRGSGRCRRRARGRRSAGATPAAARWKCDEVAIDPARDHAVGEDLPGVVHVGEERLERPHPLLDAALDRRPGVHLDHARQDVERERPLLAADVERDALVEVARLQRLDPAGQVGRIVRSCERRAERARTAGAGRRRRTSRRTPARAPG